MKTHRLQFGPLVWELMAWHLASEGYRRAVVDFLVGHALMRKG